MGLLDRWRSSPGPERRWRCLRCDAVHAENPAECQDCGHTILQQYRAAPKPKRIRSKPDYSAAEAWECAKCSHIHDRKPFVCDECGASTIRPASSVESSDSAPDYSADEENGLESDAAYWKCHSCGYLHGYQSQPEVCSGCDAPAEDALSEYSELGEIPHIVCQDCGHRHYDRVDACEYCESEDVHSVASRSMSLLDRILTWVLILLLLSLLAGGVYVLYLAIRFVLGII